MKTAYNFNPPEMGVTDPKEVGKHVDVFWATMGVERETYIKAMKAVNPNLMVGVYWSHFGNHDPKTTMYPNGQAGAPIGSPPDKSAAAKPYRNSVLNELESIPRFRDATKGEAWLRTPGNAIIYRGDKDGAVMLDFTHPAWRKAFYDSTKVVVDRNPGLWQWVIIDNANSSLYVDKVGNLQTKQFGDPNSSTFKTAYREWMIYLRVQICAALGLGFGANFNGNNAFWYEVAPEIFKHNGKHRGVFFQEYAFFNERGEYLNYNMTKACLDKSLAAFKEDALTIQVLQLNAKAAYDNPEGSEYEKFRYGLAAAKLVDPVKPDGDSLTAIRVASNYEVFYPFPYIKEIDKRLGQAKGEMYEIGGTVKGWRRDFEGGAYVELRPDERKYTIQESIITIPPTPPVISPEFINRSDVSGAAINWKIPVEGVESAMTQGLPPNINLDVIENHVVLSGTLPSVEEAVSYHVKLTARNKGGESSREMVWTISPAPPTAVKRRVRIEITDLRFEVTITPLD